MDKKSQEEKFKAMKLPELKFYLQNRGITAEEVGQLLAKHHGKFACPLLIGFIRALTSAQ